MFLFFISDPLSMFLVLSSLLSFLSLLDYPEIFQSLLIFVVIIELSSSKAFSNNKFVLSALQDSKSINFSFVGFDIFLYVAHKKVYFFYPDKGCNGFLFFLFETSTFRLIKQSNNA